MEGLGGSEFSTPNLSFTSGVTWSEPAAVEQIAGGHEAGGTHGGMGGMVAEDTENKGQSQGTFWREHRWAVLLKTMGKTQDSEPLGCSRCWLERLGGVWCRLRDGKDGGEAPSGECRRGCSSPNGCPCYLPPTEPWLF